MELDAFIRQNINNGAKIEFENYSDNPISCVLDILSKARTKVGCATDHNDRIFFAGGILSDESRSSGCESLSSDWVKTQCADLDSQVKVVSGATANRNAYFASCYESGGCLDIYDYSTLTHSSRNDPLAQWQSKSIGSFWYNGVALLLGGVRTNDEGTQVENLGGVCINPGLPDITLSSVLQSKHVTSLVGCCNDHYFCSTYYQGYDYNDLDVIDSNYVNIGHFYANVWHFCFALLSLVDSLVAVLEGMVTFVDKELVLSTLSMGGFENSDTVGCEEFKNDNTIFIYDPSTYLRTSDEQVPMLIQIDQNHIVNRLNYELTKVHYSPICDSFKHKAIFAGGTPTRDGTPSTEVELFGPPDSRPQNLFPYTRYKMSDMSEEEISDNFSAVDLNFPVNGYINVQDFILEN